MKFDLEERCLTFSKNVFAFSRTIKQDVTTRPIISQVIRSATSVGANYIEANDSLGDKDFVHRLKIARKEAKETIYWLKLLSSQASSNQLDTLIAEATELKNILSAIINKVT